MSVVYSSNAFNSPSLQIWNNEAFDDCRWPDGSAGSTPCCLPLQPISINRSETLERDSSKENHIPGFREPPVSKPLPRPKASKVQFKEESESGEGCSDDGSLDREIDEIVKEIDRLASKLEELRQKKAERDSKVARGARRGRIVPSKFLESVQRPVKGTKVSALNKVAESPASTSLRGRCLSLGPTEIRACARKPQMADVTPRRSAQSFLSPCLRSLQGIKEEVAENDERGRSSGDVSALNKVDESPVTSRVRRRFLSLGPSEISTGIGLRHHEMTDVSPVHSTQSGHMTCCRRLQDLFEEREENNERRRSTSVSPKPRRSLAGESESELSLHAAASSSILHLHKVAMMPQETKEEKMVKNEQERSLSPENRPSRAKIPDTGKGAATIGSKDTNERKGFGLPRKTLLHDAKNPLPGKKLSNNLKARTVASRYTLAPGDTPESKRRKWSLPEKGKEEVSRAGTPRMSLPRIGRNLVPINPRVNMTPRISVARSGTVRKFDIAKSPPPITEVAEYVPTEVAEFLPTEVAEFLPKIRTIRHIDDSPRDSGPAKRVIDLIGRRSHFGTVLKGEETTPTGQRKLNFATDE